MFAQKKHKRFSYHSKFSGNEKQEHKRDLKAELSSEWESTRKTSAARRKSSSIYVLILLLIILVIAMYYLDTKR